MNIELYLTLIVAFLTIDTYKNIYKWVRTRKMKSEMDKLFSEIEKTINDIKSDSNEEPRRTRRSPLKTVK